MTTEKQHHFAILAPVPLEHLISGQEVSDSKGEVAFGSMKWEFFQKLDADRDGQPIPVLIYPSYDQSDKLPGCIVSWYGEYVRCVASKNGRHPDQMEFRPESTEQYKADNAGHWAVFWHIKGLKQLPANKHIPIGKLQTVKGGWRKDAPPRGPELVALPEILTGEF